ncbi:hypothetical protein [Wocania ichthyoenteri]|uniref:hypothetical protein n=1 Tax=Wocania ichthyoenteri TaxID=1230531 RepID=UPI00053DE6CE|nr:hypothetical protein [Wocania ichthyoenteri]
MRHLEALVLTNSTTIPRILNWKVSTVSNVETIIEKLQQRPYKVLVISTEISESDKKKLYRLTSVLFENIILVEYTDDSNLEEAVKTAYWSNNKPGNSRNYLDNSFEIKLANRINSN